MTTITDGQVGYLFIGMEQRKEDEEEEKKIEEEVTKSSLPTFVTCYKCKKIFRLQQSMHTNNMVQKLLLFSSSSFSFLLSV